VEAPVHVDFLRPLTEKFVQDLKDFDKRIGLFSKLIDPAPILLLHDQNAWTSVGRTRFVDQLGKDGALVDKVICWLFGGKYGRSDLVTLGIFCDRELIEKLIKARLVSRFPDKLTPFMRDAYARFSEMIGVDLGIGRETSAKE
jgi:hypothetical protein